MATFYEIDSSRVSLREYFWGTKNPILLLLALVLKLLRVRIPSSSDDAPIDSIMGCVVNEPPADLRTRFSKVEEELAQLGFSDPVYHFIEDDATSTRISWATFRHTSGQHCARIHHRYWGKAKPTDRGLFVLFITQFTDGTFLVSSSGKPDVAAPSSIEMNRMPLATTQTLWEAHDSLVRAAVVKKNVEWVRSREETISLSERLHLVQRDFHLARKFFRLRSAAEESHAAQFTHSLNEARASGVQHPEVVAELVKLQEKKPRWSSAVLVLALSVIGFFAAGAAQWDWKITLWLIPILFLHELGHWVAMRLFNYRNLRMFFIPFFGAAVTGQNWNVPGWKKAIVSLAGPLPGIALGIALGIAGMAASIPFLKQAALMFILVNAFNLLPVLPLDGGHFLHATLFCRNRWLDIGFRSVAVIALLVMSALGLGKLLMGIGIFLAIALPIAFKMGKLTDRFRRESLPAPLPGEDRIPSETARILIGAVKQELPQNSSNTVVAQHTLNVFETLNAHPPGALATISLLVLYSGTIVASLVGGSLIYISKQGSIGDLFSKAARQPAIQVRCNEAETWSGPEAESSTPVNLLVTTFPTQQKASEEFALMTGQFSPSAIAALFGRTLILSLPAENDTLREEWFNRLQERSTNIFVVVSNNALSMSLTFLAPTSRSASNLVEELNLYYSSPNFRGLVPPWDAKAADPEFRQFREARKVWQEAGQELGKVWSDPSLEKFDKEMSNAQRRGAARELESLRLAHQKQMEKLEAEISQRLQTKYASTPHSELITLHRVFSDGSATNASDRDLLNEQIRQKLGGDESGAKYDNYGIGFFSQAGLLVQAQWLTMHNPAKNLQAVLAWLCQEGCSTVKYDLYDYSSLQVGLDEPTEEVD